MIRSVVKGALMTLGRELSDGVLINLQDRHA
jgi:hypothetical protein